MSWKMQIKRLLSELLYYSGGVAAFRQINQRRKFILAYHRVLPEDAEELHYIEPGMYVTTRTFKMHMSYLSSHFKVVSLDRLLTSSGIKNTCAVTFDDGWYDNYTYAFPILREKGIPATIFLATNKIGTVEWSWPDKICYYIHNAPLEKLKGLFNLMDHELNKYARGLSPWVALSYNKSDLLGFIVNVLKRLEDKALCDLITVVDEYMAEYKDMLFKSRPWLTWQEIDEMAANDISFGAHTHNHIIMTNTDHASNIEEVRISRDIIREHLGVQPEAFCYPNGDFNEEIVDIVRRQGYKLAVTTQPGTINESDNPLTLKRIMIHNDVSSTVPMFACRIINMIAPFS